MLDDGSHQQLAEAQAWAQEHPDILAAAWRAFDAGGEWPHLEQLQRDFERASVDLDVGTLAWGMPSPLGFVEQECVVLLVRGLSFVPEARQLLDDWASALALAYQRYVGPDEPILRRADLREELNLDDHRADRVSRLLFREGWAFSGGRGGPEDDWDRSVRSGVRAARGTCRADEVLAARDAVEYPSPPPSGSASGEVAVDADVGESTATAPSGSNLLRDKNRQRRVMVVHGRDGQINAALFSWLRSIDLRPQEWTELVAATGLASPYTGEVLDIAMREVQAVVVLFTPDDLVRLRDDLLRPDDRPVEREVMGQPRPNVLFEAGLAFGRHRERTVLVEYGDLRGLTDLQGLHAVRLVRGAAALKDLAQRLKTAGCAVNMDGDEWLDATPFLDLSNSDDQGDAGVSLLTTSVHRSTGDPAPPVSVDARSSESPSPAEDRSAMSHSIERLGQAATLSRRQLASKLADLFHEGTALRQKINFSRADFIADTINGTSDRRQVQREQAAVRWDRLVWDALPEDLREEWEQAASSIAHDSTLALVEPVSDISEISDFLGAKLQHLKQVIQRLGSHS